MKKQLILFLFSISFLMSCEQTKRLSLEDYKWIPYNGNETLVFTSNTGDIDTIFLLKKDTLLAYAEPVVPRLPAGDTELWIKTLL